MKQFNFAFATTCILGMAVVANAQSYNFTFTGNDGIDATGTITISGGVATDGSINVINVPLESLPGTTTASGDLLSLSAGSAISSSQSNVRTQDGTVITYDVAAYAPPSDPIFDGTGVAFASGYAGLQSSTPSYDTVVNIWGNGPGSYGMFIGEANPAYLNANGNPIDGNQTPHDEVQWVYVYDETGTLALTPVPEPTTLALAGLGGLSVLLFRRQRK